MKNKASLASRLYMALIFIFLYAPIAVMTVFSFNSGSSTYIMDGFSTSWWGEMFHDTAAMNALKNTVLLAHCNNGCFHRTWCYGFGWSVYAEKQIVQKNNDECHKHSYDES